MTTLEAIAVAAGVAGFVGGVSSGATFLIAWKSRLRREAQRERDIDRHLVETEQLVPRFLGLEATVKVHGVELEVLKNAVGRLVTTQDETNRILRDLAVQIASSVNQRRPDAHT